MTNFNTNFQVPQGSQLRGLTYVDPSFYGYQIPQMAWGPAGNFLGNALSDSFNRSNLLFNSANRNFNNGFGFNNGFSGNAFNNLGNSFGNINNGFNNIGNINALLALQALQGGFNNSPRNNFTSFNSPFGFNGGNFSGFNGNQGFNTNQFLANAGFGNLVNQLGGFNGNNAFNPSTFQNGFNAFGRSNVLGFNPTQFNGTFPNAANPLFTQNPLFNQNQFSQNQFNPFQQQFNQNQFSVNRGVNQGVNQGTGSTSQGSGLDAIANLVRNHVAVVQRAKKLGLLRRKAARLRKIISESGVSGPEKVAANLFLDQRVQQARDIINGKSTSSTSSTSTSSS